MCGDDFHSEGRGRQGDNRRGGHIKVPGTAAEPVRQRLAGGKTEYLEEESDLGMAGETHEEGGSGSDYIGGVLSRGITGSATLWGRDMGPHIFDGEDNGGCTYRVLEIDDGEERKESAGRVLEEGICRQRAKDGGDTTIAKRTFDKRQATVVECVATRPIFKVCVQEETDHVGGGRQRAPWWRKTAVEAQLRATLKVILETERDQRKQESCRRG